MDHVIEHSDIGYHTAVRWLSLGKVLKRVWDLKAEIRECCEKKAKDIPELSDEDWMADFAFAVDVTALMNELNTKLQGKGLFVHEMHSLVKAFMRKMQFLSSQLESNTLTRMQTLKEVTPPADHLRRYSSMLGALHGEFSRQFEDLRTIEDEMLMISSPFTCSVDNAPSDVQLELIDRQSDAVLAEHFKSGSLLDFYSSLKEEDFPNMRRHAQKMLVLFGATYICEHTFSMMNFTKSSGYDFGYLIKILSNANLPEEEVDFFEILRLYFPIIYDVKYLMKSCKNLKGGLQEVAEQLELERIGPQHQAGSDSLLTGMAFFKMREMFFEDHIDDAKYCGHLYGLGSGSTYVQNGTGNAYEEEANKQQS
ncbi:CCR4-NOT transcription complex subunit 7 isoform X1 [Eleginops maclovinus]